MLLRQGWEINRKPVYRVYRELGLAVRSGVESANVSRVGTALRMIGLAAHSKDPPEKADTQTDGYEPARIDGSHWTVVRHNKLDCAGLEPLNYCGLGNCRWISLLAEVLDDHSGLDRNGERVWVMTGDHRMYVTRFCLFKVKSYGTASFVDRLQDWPA